MKLGCLIVAMFLVQMFILISACLLLASMFLWQTTGIFVYGLALMIWGIVWRVLFGFLS